MTGLIRAAGLKRLCDRGGVLKVTGVFSSAVYLRSESGDTVMLHDSSYGSIPFGIALDGISHAAGALGLDIGTALFMDSRRLYSPLTGFSLELKYDFEDITATPIQSECGLRSLVTTLYDALVQDGRSPLLVFARPDMTYPPKSALDDMFARAGYESMVRLAAVFSDRSTDSLCACLDGLLGLGRGLTPSFDDFLWGCCYTLNLCTRADPVSAALNEALIAKAPQHTNSFSSAYLIAAASGGDFSLLRQLLCSPPGSARSLAIDAMLAVGSSSGSDILCGVLFALNYVLKHPDSFASA